MSGVKKERWAEAEVLALPAGEHDYFERKSGAILSDPNFRQDVAKAVCAMANSGGGHVILGIGDNSVIDGVPLTKGAISTRDWIEQITPHLLSYPLEDFRVHEVEPATRSTIPAGTVVIVVDVGDSVLAPHQTAGTRTYYYREAGRSVPAPHHYLEMLRNRLTGPQLKATLEDVEVVQARLEDRAVKADLRLRFVISNQGRVAAYKWALVIAHMKVPTGREGDFEYRGEHLGSSAGIRLDTTILPSLGTSEHRYITITVRPSIGHTSALKLALSEIASGEDIVIGYRVVSEVSPGEVVDSALLKVVQPASLAKAIADKLGWKSE